MRPVTALLISITLAPLTALSTLTVHEYAHCVDYWHTHGWDQDCNVTYHGAPWAQNHPTNAATAQTGNTPIHIEHAIIYTLNAAQALLHIGITLTALEHTTKNQAPKRGHTKNTNAQNESLIY